MPESHLNQTVKNILSSLSLEEKLLQLIISGFTFDDKNIDLFESVKSGLGGLIFFRDNIQSPEQAEKLIFDLQNVSKIQLFISIDQEGGLIERINGVAQVPTFAALGACGDIEFVKSAQDYLLRDLRSIGFNMNYSPVLDVNTEPLNPVIGVRSFGDDPLMVAEYGQVVIDQHNKYGIIPVIKHFPGHGASTVDSHLALPSIELSHEQMYNVHLYPFKKAIESGIDVIMVCHAFFPGFTESNELPASLSRDIITGLLRNKLGYDGLVITDDLQMNAIVDLFSVEQAAVMALKAGVDILLYRDLNNAYRAFRFLVDQVNSGNLDVDLINKSAEKILLLKLKYNIINSNNTDLIPINDYEISNNCIMYSVDELFEGTLLVYKQPKDFPDFLNGDSSIFIYPDRSGLHHYFSEDPDVFSLIHPCISKAVFSLNPSESEIADLLTKISSYKNVILVVYNAVFNPGHADLINSIAEKHDIYALMAGVKSDLLYLRNSKFLAGSFSYRDKAIEAFMHLLTRLTGANESFFK